MITWLDEYLDLCVSGSKALNAYCARTYGFEAAYENDWHRFDYFVRLNYASPQFREEAIREGFWRGFDLDDRLWRAYHAWVAGTVDAHLEAGSFGVLLENIANKVVPWVLDVEIGGKAGQKPLAVQVTSELAGELVAAPAVTGNAWLDVIHQHGCVYIDIPRGALTVPDADNLNLSARALLVTLDIWNERDLREFWMQRGQPIFDPTYPKLNVLLVGAIPGPLSISKVWQFGFASGEPHSAYGRKPEWNPLILAEAGVDPVAALTPRMQATTDLLSKVLTAYLDENVSRRALPRINRDEWLRIPSAEKRTAKLQSHTLFDVTRLRSSRGR